MVVDHSRERKGGHNGHPLTGSDECQRRQGVVVLMNSLNPCPRGVPEASSQLPMNCALRPPRCPSS